MTAEAPTMRRSEPAPQVDGRRARRRAARGRLLRDRTAVAGLVMLLAYLLLAAAGPWLAPNDPNAIEAVGRFQPPGGEHLLGTDQLGRDIASRLLHGARLSVGLALLATAGTTLLGLGLGLVSGVHGGLADTLVMRVVDVLQALPGLLLALALVGMLGPSLRNLLIAIVAVWWAGYARLVRGLVLSVRERPFVEAARALGAGEGRILVRHVLPNMFGPVIVLSTLDLGRAVLAISGLSFLGLGAPPPTPEWGAMLAEARVYLDRAPQLLMYPGVAITLFGLSCNLVGDAVRDAFDPRMRNTL